MIFTFKATLAPTSNNEYVVDWNEIEDNAAAVDGLSEWLTRVGENKAGIVITMSRGDESEHDADVMRQMDEALTDTKKGGYWCDYLQIMLETHDADAEAQAKAIFVARECTEEVNCIIKTLEGDASVYVYESAEEAGKQIGDGFDECPDWLTEYVDWAKRGEDVAHGKVTINGNTYWVENNEF